ncbi:MAG: GDP-mannose 4,6-dehydratase [Opitutaceae bacterium]
MKDKTAFITGITGQDGSYLTDDLLEQGYTVHGLVHRPDSLGSSHISRHLLDSKVFNKRLFLHSGSLEDPTNLRRVIFKAKPDEFYHLAGQSSPRLSLERPQETVDSVGMATFKLLEILRDLEHPSKFLYASSSEVFGSPEITPQDETTPVNPTTPYGAAKAFSQQMTRIYRDAYGLQTCSAILYNHESPRRSDNFVTMKIARAVAKIKKGQQKTLKLGALNGQRDWGWAPDYVRGMTMMLNADTSNDYVLATGKLHSVEQLVEKAFQCAGLRGEDHIEFDKSLVSTVEPIAPCGNSNKAQKLLGWKPTVDFDEMIRRLVESEIDKLAK